MPPGNSQQLRLSPALVPSLALGVIGAGRWGRHWVRVCSGLRGAHLAAICDADGERARALGDNYARVPWFGSVEAMLEQAELDAVVVATPTSSHAKLSLAALEAGCHVLVEKPLAASRSEALSVAHHAGGRVMVGHLLRYHPGVVRIHDLIRAGELGAVTHVVCERLGAAAPGREETSWWALAPHDISVMRFLLGAEPDSVQATSSAAQGAHPEDAMTALLTFPEGQLGVIRVGGDTPRRLRRITVVGERRSVTFADQHGVAWLSQYASPVSFDPLQGPLAARSIQKEPVGGGEPLALQGQHFVDCLRFEQPFATDAWEGLAVVRALEAGSLAVRLGQTVRVEGEGHEPSSAVAFAPRALGAEAC